MFARNQRSLADARAGLSKKEDQAQDEHMKLRLLMFFETKAAQGKYPVLSVEQIRRSMKTDMLPRPLKRLLDQLVQEGKLTQQKLPHPELPRAEVHVYSFPVSP